MTNQRKTCNLLITLLAALSYGLFTATAPLHAGDHDNHGPAQSDAESEDTHADHDDHKDHAHSEGKAEARPVHEDHGDHEDHAGHGHAQGEPEAGDAHAGQEGHDGHDDAEGTIRLDPETLREFGITMETARPGILDLHTTLPGEVRVNEDQQAHIVPRYSGLVVEVKKHIGDHVEKGDVLAVLEGNESLATYELKSLISGTLIEKHITLGESLKDDEVVFVVANLETVWIDLAVYQKDMAVIRTGQQAVVYAGDHLPSGTGSISYISPTVDEHTRTSLARVVLANPEGHWRPGMFVTGRIKTHTSKASVVVPRDAVIALAGQPSLFVQTGKGLEPRPVTLGLSDGQRVEILTGLAAGESFAARNVLPLKAELNRAALEHAGHAH